MPKLISDLAIMLLTAGVVAVLFKRFKLPLVLGYILAGFVRSWVVCLLVGVALVLAVLFILRRGHRNQAA